MATWFDLPAEVKQLIFSMVSDADSIIYVPKDRRRTVDHNWLEAHHFHDLLLVSKTFITPDEFAFAILASAKLTFYSYNELRRLIEEVPTTFKESIRRLHLGRICYGTDVATLTDHDSIIFFRDSFDGFCTIDKTLSTHMPNLRQIYISWPEHCALTSWFQIDNHSIKPEDEHCSSVIRKILSQDDHAQVQGGHLHTRHSLSHVVASCLGDRTRPDAFHNWTRPVTWIRRLMLYAESANIEVVLQIKLCVSHTYRGSNVFIEYDDNVHKTCFSVRGYESGAYGPVWQIHLDAEMSSKDYMLRTEHEGINYACYQKLAYDLLHAPPRNSRKGWLDLVKEVPARYSMYGRFF